MSNEHDGHGFSANKIFIVLFVLTAVEVAWSIVFKHSPHWIKWGGLMIFAFWKGMLIYTYFMHMKFEGWVVKALVAPTPLLIAILVFALMPDVSYNDQLVYPVGSQLDRSTVKSGQVHGLIDLPHGTAAPANH
jgi:caa(3)-type oxidase subunit IV